MSPLPAEAPGPVQDGLIAAIHSATDHEQILQALPPLGMGAIADRLAYLHREIEDDPEESPIALTSLRQCALFFVSEPGHRTANLSVSPDGLVLAEWRRKEGELLAVRFQPSGDLQFAGVAESSVPGEPWRISGTLPKDQALQAVAPFFAQRRP